MDVNVINELQNGLSAAYINGSVAANLAYKPAFVSNNPEEGKKVISSVEDELLRCEEFQISVAFITMGGVTPLLQTLKELEKKGVKGQILTTNYLNFSEPRALEKLNGLKNITLKMYDVEAAGNGFHTKGYIFRKEEIYRIIIGSSNMTSAALTVNKEWNTKLISTENGEVAEEIIEEFNLFASIIRQADREIVLIDGYVDIDTLNILSKKKEGVKTIVYTLPSARITKKDVETFNAQYSELVIQRTTEFHDRFLILDGNIGYNIGASIKDAGKKCFGINKIEDDVVIKALIKRTGANKVSPPSY